MKRPVKVLYMRVGESPEVVTIDHSLEAMQHLVHGYIELVRLSDGVDLWCNEEGLLDGSLPNRFVREVGGEIRGDFFIARTNDDGATVSIEDRDIKRYAQLFKL